MDLQKLIPKESGKNTHSFSTIITSSKNVGYFAAIIAIDALGEGHVIGTNPNNLYDTELLDGTSLTDNVDYMKKLQPGIYKCQIKIYSFRCNIPDDPEEWDMTVTLEDIEEIKLSL